MIPTHIILSHFLWLEWMAELIFLPFAIERKTRQSFISRPSLQTIRWQEKLWNGSNITYINDALKPRKQRKYPSQIEKSSQIICFTQIENKQVWAWMGLRKISTNPHHRAKPKHDLWFIRVSLVSDSEILHSHFRALLII